MATNQNQSRFFLAVALSLGVLLLWSYLFPPPKQNNPNANQNTQIAANTASSPAAQSSPEAAQQQTQIQNNQADNTPSRTITIKTSLYEAKFDSRGALITSWILKKSKTGDNERQLFSASSTKDNPLPLELIPAEGLKRREVPLKILTGDAALDSLLNDRNYQIAGVDGDEIALNDGETREVQFVLRDEANGVEAIKSLTFNGGSYVSDLKTKITRNNQTVPEARLLVGASIGDQGIKYFDYYSIESEAVASVNDSTERHRGVDIIGSEASKRLPINGAANWAGVADTYFAMAAIPAQPVAGLQFQSAKYDVALAEPFTNGIWGFITGQKIDKQTRHLTSALVPIAADGGITKLYVGTKDYFLLSQVSENMSGQVGRRIELDKFINFSWMGAIIRPLAIPILWTLNKINAVTQNYGTAILVFTFVFFSLLFPMRWYQSKSFKKAAKNAPRMKELQDRYKEMQAKGVATDDPKMRELQMEQLKLTKDAVPLGGCLPLLLQFPLLIALYTAITISLDFRQASFLWLPDLSAADPYHLLEFVFAGSMMLSMIFTPTAPAITPEQQMQQRMMTYFMPLMMLWVMWGSPSGLLVYWVASNVIGFAQQLIINRINKTNDEPPAANKATNERPLTKKERMKTSLSTP